MYDKTWKMTTNSSIFRAILMISLIMALSLIISGCNSSNGIDSTTAKCIGLNSKLYISSGCPSCVKQEELFGKNFKYLDVIDCAEKSEECIEDNIVIVPTWYFGERKIESLIYLNQLEEITGC